jgi:AcrR family transcriptional regulator
MARPAKTNEKRNEVMQKAKSTFTRFGYAKTTLDDIAREAGMNKATLYHYFKNKEALFLQVMLQVATEGLQDLMMKTSKLKTPEKQLLYFFAERTDLYLRLVRLNSLTKESLLQLQEMFDSIYLPEKEKEIVFVAGIVQQLLPKANNKIVGSYARLMFSVADALKHEGVFLGKLLEGNVAQTETVKKQITTALQIIINGF